MTYKVTPSELTEITLAESDDVAAILQNVAIILGTYKGEVPLDRDFGISPSIMHRPVNAAKALIISEVNEQINKYEPRAKVKSVSIEVSGSGYSTLIPTVEVEINE